MSEHTETGKLIPYLVEMFRYQAWIAMGKVMNPVTKEVERDLPAARQFIDLLGELERRTEGNRSADETRLLQGALTELRLNYVEEVKRPAEADGGGSEAPAGAAAEDSSLHEEKS